MTNVTELTRSKGIVADTRVCLTHPGSYALARTYAVETPTHRLSEVLFEQLGYLIQFSDQERDRLDRVKAILLENFN